MKNHLNENFGMTDIQVSKRRAFRFERVERDVRVFQQLVLLLDLLLQRLFLDAKVQVDPGERKNEAESEKLDLFVVFSCFQI